MRKIVEWLNEHFVTAVVIITLIVVTAVISGNHDHSKCNHGHGTHHTDTRNP